jgi:hypothetical protein
MACPKSIEKIALEPNIMLVYAFEGVHRHEKLTLYMKCSTIHTAYEGR